MKALYIMKTELEIAYGRSKARYQDTLEFINKLKILANQNQIIKQDLETIIREFERKIQP